MAQLGAGSMAAVAETQNSLAGLQKWLQCKAMKPANAGVFTDENARNLQVQSTQQAFFHSVWQRQSRLRALGMVCSLLCARLNASTKCLRHYVERSCGMFSSAKLHFALESSPPDRKKPVDTNTVRGSAYPPTPPRGFDSGEEAVSQQGT